MKLWGMLIVLGLLLITPVVGQDKSPAPLPATITKAELEKRITELAEGLEQAKANVHAYEGAIQDCKYWLQQLDSKEKLAPVTKEAKQEPSK